MPPLIAIAPSPTPAAASALIVTMIGATITRALRPEYPNGAVNALLAMMTAVVLLAPRHPTASGLFEQGAGVDTKPSSGGVGMRKEAAV
ncbi:hypothetical protein [Mycobacterium lacus]|uniref:hypothetical protein n=1 Tax=Mycobacterium lacus TaxID=169765 RepID=UPI0013D8864B|nr:hypothetical protein [Mycobacterium lacus]